MKRFSFGAGVGAVPVLVAVPALAACSAAGTGPLAAGHGGGAVHTTAYQTATKHGRDDGKVIGDFIREGGPLGPSGQQPKNVPLSGTIMFESRHHRTIDVRVGNSGRFSVWLPARMYSVTGKSPDILTQLPSGASQEDVCSLTVTVKVRADHTTWITVVCPVP
jgi:hypothetical protein